MRGGGASGQTPREDRVAVLVPSRMRVGARWCDICIRNVSSRGLMAASDSPPERGSYVEIRRGNLAMVGRVIWSDRRSFGVRLQDRVSLHALVAEPRLAARPDAQPDAVERRSEMRVSAEARVVRQAERSRALSAAIQYIAVVAAIVMVAGVGAHSVYQYLSRPAERLSGALAVPSN